MENTSAAYVVAVPQDYASALVAFEAMGLERTWTGSHPLYGDRCTLFASRSGGVLVVDSEGTNDTVVAAVADTTEAWFRTCLAVPDVKALRSKCQSVDSVTRTSELVNTEWGPSFCVDVETGTTDRPLRLEFVETTDTDLFTAETSAFSRIESIAMVYPTRQLVLEGLRGIGFEVAEQVSDAYFESLGCINSVIWVGDAYLEINEPTAERGTMSGLLGRLDGGGIFGLNLQPVSMRGFVQRAEEEGIEVNTREPILLEVELDGSSLRVAEIITINPRWTKGARIFVLDPYEYPWNFR